MSKGIPVESFDCYVIEQANHFIMAVDDYGEVRSTLYKWDAWQAKSRREAEMVAGRFRGPVQIRRFNPVTGVFG